MMRAVNIAQLKSRLSAYLQEVRGGEEIVIRDRDLPVAKLMPLEASEADAGELALAAAGKLRLPAERLDQEAFWAIGRGLRGRTKAAKAVREAVSRDREERDAGVLGR